jgi:anthranilate phosphoribosyltransferase
MALREALTKLLDHADLTSAEAAAALDEILTGATSPPLISAFLVALRMKGETPDEIAGLAGAMRDKAVPVRAERTGLVDTCGTGGDAKGTLNISTAAALVVAGAGLPVAKHGNVAISSKSGSADVLQALGVRLDLKADQVAQCIDRAGIGFLFAPAFHPALAAIMPVRRELAVRTAFNILGPLTNPARPSFQLVGVGVPEHAALVAGALAAMGIERAVVVHGAGGADELTLEGENLVLFVENGRIRKDSAGPDDVGLQSCELLLLQGGDPEENAKRLRRLLDGEPGPFRDCVLFNAGAAFVAAGVTTDMREGVEVARKTLDAGEAGQALERLVGVAKSFR